MKAVISIAVTMAATTDGSRNGSERAQKPLVGAEKGWFKGESSPGLLTGDKSPPNPCKGLFVHRPPLFDSLAPAGLGARSPGAQASPSPGVSVLEGHGTCQSP